jgi:hypothetical protein
VLHGLRHVLTPGTPGYAALKTGAVAVAFAAQYAVRHRTRRRGHPHDGPPTLEPSHEAPGRSHPRSKKKRRRRR